MTRASVQLPLPLPVPSDGPERWRPVPSGLVPSTPDDMTPLTASLARHEVLAAHPTAAAARLLLARGLAVMAVTA